jgi:O-antigen/teichoic acid export membrane protein
MSPESLQSFFALAIGFAVAGLISTGYQALTQRPASFSLLEHGAHPSTFAAVPLLAFAAPFIIMRNTVRGRRIEHRRFEFVMIATIIAGIWSLMSGTVVVMAIEALGTFFV